MLNLLTSVLGVTNKKISKNKIMVLEVVTHIYFFKKLSKYYGCRHLEGEIMIDGNVVKILANDLIINDDYSIRGLSEYTGFPEDVIYDVVSGINRNPTITLANKIMELHIGSRKNLYKEFLKNIGDLSNVI